MNNHLFHCWSIFPAKNPDTLRLYI